MSAHSAGAYTATLLVMVHVRKGGGRTPPPSPAWDNFTLMMECMPESSRCYSVAKTINAILKDFSTEKSCMEGRVNFLGVYSMGELESCEGVCGSGGVKVYVGVKGVGVYVGLVVCGCRWE